MVVEGGHLGQEGGGGGEHVRRVLAQHPAREVDVVHRAVMEDAACEGS